MCDGCGGVWWRRSAGRVRAGTVFGHAGRLEEGRKKVGGVKIGSRSVVVVATNPTCVVEKDS